MQALTEPLYLLERVPNLKFFQLWIFLNQECQQPKVHLFPNRIDVAQSHQSTLLSVQIEGGIINPSKASMSLNSNILDIKMPTSNMYDIEPRETEKLTPNQLQNVFCSCCSAPITAGKHLEPTFQRVLILPSLNWMELTEMWFCNCGHNHNSSKSFLFANNKQNMKKWKQMMSRRPERSKRHIIIQVQPSSLIFLLVHILPSVIMERKNNIQRRSMLAK